MRIPNWNRPPTPKKKEVEDKPEQGKVYALFGAKGEACIAKGNTWAESEVKDQGLTKSERAGPLTPHERGKSNCLYSEKILDLGWTG